MKYKRELNQLLTDILNCAVDLNAHYLAREANEDEFEIVPIDEEGEEEKTLLDEYSAFLRTDADFWELWEAHNINTRVEEMTHKQFFDAEPENEYATDKRYHYLINLMDELFEYSDLIRPFFKRKYEETNDFANYRPYYITWNQLIANIANERLEIGRMHWDDLVKKCGGTPADTLRKREQEKNANPTEQPEPPTLTDNELRMKVEHDAILLGCIESDNKQTAIDTRIDIACKIIENGLHAKNNGNKQWQSIVFKAIDRECNNHTFKSLQPKEFCTIFAQYGLNFNDKNFGEWRNKEMRKEKDKNKEK